MIEINCKHSARSAPVLHCMHNHYSSMVIVGSPSCFNLALIGNILSVCVFKDDSTVRCQKVRV